MQYIRTMKYYSALKRTTPTDTWYIMDEPEKHCAKWKKLNKKDHISYDSIYMKCLEKTSLHR